MADSAARMEQTTEEALREFDIQSLQLDTIAQNDMVCDLLNAKIVHFRFRGAARTAHRDQISEQQFIAFLVFVVVVV